MMCHIVTRRRSPTEPPDDEPERKERVIHTRVPERLEAELRERAQELGVSVSNLVRNVLGHAFGLVGDVVADSHAIARAARGERTPAPRVTEVTSIDDVLGWQPIVLAKNALCAKCNAILPKGKDAAVGVNSQLVVCPACLKELRS
ncbi:MAG TPA: hypothetical protein VM513_09605 [Kofleriaceae bacterium]|jgi:hypothetical protein|nr:hypothetical protein [Kofleriaceae bacterium]